MDKELRDLDSADLKTLYDKHLDELSQALLSGAEWKDVQDKRKLLIELSRLLHTGRRTHNPAENANRQ